MALLEGWQPTPKVEAARLLACGCGAQFELSARNARIHRVNGTVAQCSDCRYGASRPIRVTQAMRDWWLERYTFEQICELAAPLDR